MSLAFKVYDQFQFYLVLAKNIYFVHCIYFEICYLLETHKYKYIVELASCHHSACSWQHLDLDIRSWKTLSIQSHEWRHKVRIRLKIEQLGEVFSAHAWLVFMTTKYHKTMKQPEAEKVIECTWQIILIYKARCLSVLLSPRISTLLHELKLYFTFNLQLNPKILHSQCTRKYLQEKCL